jgi:DDE superfamily endonuclease
LKDDLKLLSLSDRQVGHNERPIRYFVQDESRFGLKTLSGRLLTAVGIKPMGTWQWLFKAFWLYGAVEPATGASFFLQFSHVDTECFQRFLTEFPQAYPDSLNIIQLDNGRFHSGKKLVLPDNIVLLFQPPYCPELNPIEHLWQYLTADLRWADFKTLDELQTKLGQLLAELTPELIASQGKRIDLKLF